MEQEQAEQRAGFGGGELHGPPLRPRDLQRTENAERDHCPPRSVAPYPSTRCTRLAPDGSAINHLNSVARTRLVTQTGTVIESKTFRVPVAAVLAGTRQQRGGLPAAIPHPRS
ncbi:hypothetical protein GCM10023170_014670 [Phytohabitans houttuyneae]|uniref:Uncharacterized protein n=1 Tax=Phytohabitans houttuyneae TaxID=1076126 RepID=A0A6V8KLN4_9ACTN|nr:hypothetical protein Phou_102920 [Phytohabitans houttuyneae]